MCEENKVTFGGKLTCQMCKSEFDFLLNIRCDDEEASVCVNCRDEIFEAAKERNEFSNDDQKNQVIE